MSERKVGEVMVPLLRLAGAPSSNTSLFVREMEMSNFVVSFLKISMSVLKRTFMRSKPFFLAVDLASM